MFCLQVLTAKLVQVGSNMPSSPDSSSDSSTGSPQHPYEGPNVEAENCLPGVVSFSDLLVVCLLFPLVLTLSFDCKYPDPIISCRNVCNVF